MGSVDGSSLALGTRVTPLSLTTSSLPPPRATCSTKFGECQLGLTPRHFVWLHVRVWGDVLGAWVQAGGHPDLFDSVFLSFTAWVGTSFTLSGALTAAPGADAPPGASAGAAAGGSDSGPTTDAADARAAGSPPAATVVAAGKAASAAAASAAAAGRISTLVDAVGGLVAPPLSSLLDRLGSTSVDAWHRLHMLICCLYPDALASVDRLGPKKLLRAVQWGVDAALLAQVVFLEGSGAPPPVGGPRDVFAGLVEDPTPEAQEAYLHALRRGAAAVEAGGADPLTVPRSLSCWSPPSQAPGDAREYQGPWRLGLKIGDRVLVVRQGRLARGLLKGAGRHKSSFWVKLELGGSCGSVRLQASCAKSPHPPPPPPPP